MDRQTCEDAAAKAEQTLQETAGLSLCLRHITLPTHQGKGTES